MSIDTEDVEEVSSGVIEESRYRCCECFDVFTEEELPQGVLAACPNCRETDCIALWK